MMAKRRPGARAPVRRGWQAPGRAPRRPTLRLVPLRRGRPAHARRRPLALTPGPRAELLARCERAVRRARAGGGGGAGRRSPCRSTPRTDPSAVAFASRRAGEPWFCFEQPDRDGAALATLGCVRAIRASGARALRRRRGGVARRWPAGGGRRAGRAAGAGLVAVGGFAFAPDGGAAPPLARLRGRPISWSRRSRSPAAAATCGSRWPRVAHADDAARAARRAPRRAGGRAAHRPRCRCSTPRPPGASTSRRSRRRSTTRRPSRAPSSGSAPATFEKIVLAREVAVHAPGAARRRRGVRRAAGRVRAPASCSASARGDAAFVAASPGAAGAPRGPAGLDRRAGGLDPPLGRPGRRRPPRRAAPALRQGPRGAADRRPPHRPRAAPVLASGSPRRTSRRSSRSRTSSTSRRRSARSSPTRAARSSSPGSCTRRRPSAASRTRSPRR